MNLRRLRLRRFKRFKDWTATFSPGLNVIQGPNEAGKTTVMEAVFAALLVNPAQPPATFKELMRTWGERRLGEVTLELEVGGQLHLLRKDFEAGTALLQRQDEKESLENPRQIQQSIMGWLGLPGEAAFRSTAYVGQGELARISDERHLIGTRLSKILSGGGTQDVEGAIRWIDERRRGVEADGGGRLGAINERLQALLTEQRELGRKEELAQSLTTELRTLTHQLGLLEQQIQKQTEQATAAERYEALTRREHELERDLRANEELTARLDGILARLPGLETRLKEVGQHQGALRARRITQNLLQALRTAHQQLEREEDTLEQLATGHQRARLRGDLGFVMGALSGAAIAAGIFLMLRGLLAGWAMVGVGAVIILLGLRVRGRVADMAARYRMQEQRVLDVRKRVEQARAQASEAEEELRARLGTRDAAAVEAFEQRFAAYMEVVREQEEVRRAAQQLVGDQSREQIVERGEGLRRELAEVRGRLQAIPEAVIVASGEAERVRSEVQRLEKEAPALRERKARIEGMLEGLRERPEQHEQLEEEIAALQDQQASLARTVEVLDLTRRMLEEAQKQSLFPARELLERRASEYLRVATRDGYQKVALDEWTMRPTVWVAAADGWKGPESLSRGTVDQLYLALRFALLDVICEGRTPPIFLDEPLVHFDPERMAAALSLLGTIARERQVFLFTAWPRDGLPADQVITLPAAGREAPTPSAGNQG
jgi:uncharacterized protein YhaN